MDVSQKYISSWPTVVFFWLTALVCCVAMTVGCDNHQDPIELFHKGEYLDSFRIFNQQAAVGDIQANNYLGIHYYLGMGVTRDFVQAAKLFEKAALGEVADAQRNLGIMYLRGFGVEQDYHQAYGWFFAAHAGGNSGAKEYLNLMGDNVTPNASQIAREKVRNQIATGASVVQR